MSMPSGDDAQQSTEALSVATKVVGRASDTAEMKKVVPLAAMFVLIFFNYLILRDTKDVLIVTAPDPVAGIHPFLKTYVSLPAAIGFTVLYCKLNNLMSSSKVFYACITPFLAFFATFAAFIYPARDSLHPHAAADYLEAHLPVAFGPLIYIFRNWAYAVFYAAAELWGSAVVSVLFWGLVNQITTTKEAKKYYPLFGLGANVALIFAGQYVRFVSAFRASLPAHVDKWAASVELLMVAVCALGVAIVGIHHHIQKNVISDPECVPAEVGRPQAKTATTMGMRESARYLAASPYMRNLAMLVIAQGMSMTFVDVTWRESLRKAFPDRDALVAFMDNLSTTTGSMTIVMMILGRIIFQMLGWTTVALLTPIVLGLTGEMFFCLTLFREILAPLLAFIGTTSVMATVLIGAAHSILLKSSEYSLFDPCKEMAYINLDPEQKIKGKAVVDVIGNLLGRISVPIIHQVLIVSLGSLSASVPCLAAIHAGIICVWFTSATSLGGLIKKIEHKEEADDMVKARKSAKLPDMVTGG